MTYSLNDFLLSMKSCFVFQRRREKVLAGDQQRPVEGAVENYRNIKVILVVLLILIVARDDTLMS